MLEITWTSDEPKPAAGQVLAIPTQADADLTAFESRFGGPVRHAIEAAKFRGKPGETFVFTRELGGHLQRVVVFGTGEGPNTAAAVRRLGHDVVRSATSVGATSIVLDLRAPDRGDLPDVTPAQLGNLMAQGLELGTYAYDRFVAEDSRVPKTVKSITVWSDTPAANEGSRRGGIVANAVARARDLGNGPAELVTPTHLADTAKEIVAELKTNGIDAHVDVLERDACAKLGMGCFLGVAKGSDEPPKFIHLRYRPKGANDSTKGRVVLVGKGVTFDSGGYSIKTSEGMLEMKLDMCGAAAVISAFEGAARLGVPWELHVLVAATENMVSGHAYRLGDVLTASNGKTVEINNTDAEGRLTLADAMIYGSKLEPDLMIDFATLTGACVVALGPRIAGVMSHDDRLARDFLAAADRSGETMWRLPLPDDLKDQLKSKIADMKNTGERSGGALTAGLFLSEFTGGRRWMHVDIAGPSMVSKPYGVTSAGGSGFAVATILELLSGEIEL